ncbi:hypothetical protein [Actinophytocola sp.]|uniref:hypothetical protein n=1 Tax=Actinophytocola sp. TaxID=1872138 RepID=UPI002ED3B53D
MHGPLREQREYGRPDVAATRTPAAAAPLTPATPVTATAGKAPERTAGPRHPGPRTARRGRRKRREGHPSTGLAKVLLHVVELGTWVAERRSALEWMVVSE